MRTIIEVLVVLCERGQRGISAQELVHELGVSRATVYRAIAELRHAGVSIERVVAQDARRVRLARPLTTPGLTLDAAGRLALRLLFEEHPGLHGTFVGRVLEAIAQTDPPRPRRVALDAVESVVVRALEHRLRISLRYQVRGAREPRERTVEPLRFCLRNGRLHLECKDADHARVHVLDLARMRDLRVLIERLREPLSPIKIGDRRSASSQTG